MWEKAKPSLDHKEVMMKYGKKYAESLKAYDKTRPYEAAEAVNIVLGNAKAKFDETIELHVRLGIDPRQADQQVMKHSTILYV